MEKPSVTLDQQELVDQSTAFGLLVRSLEKECERIVDEHFLAKEACVLYSVVFFLSPKMDGQTWNAALISTMDVLAHRALAAHTAKEIRFPEWDPEDVDHADCRSIADAFINLYAWNRAVSDETLPPEDFLGPLFTCAGAVMEGVSRGYHLTDPEIQKVSENYLERLYSRLTHPEKGPEMLQKQLLSLSDTYHQFLRQHDEEGKKDA